MKKIYLLLIFSLLSCQNKDLDKLEDLSNEYLTNGRSDSVKNEIMFLLDKCDSIYGNNTEYLDMKLHVYTVIDDQQSRREVVSEIPNHDLEQATDIFNRASDLIYAGKNEGVVELLSKLNKKDKKLYRFLIHDVFAILISDVRFDSIRINNYKILKQLYETKDKKVIEEIVGIDTWVRSMQASSGGEILQFVRSNKFGNNAHSLRYQFLVANLLTQYNGYQVYADSLVSSAITKANEKLKKIPQNPSERKDIEERALLRYYIAYGSYLKYKYLLDNNKSEELSNRLQDTKKEYLRIASNYSGDQRDIKVKHAYFYDVHILNGKEEYRTEFLEFLKRQNLYEESLEEAIKILINNPDRIDEVLNIINFVEENYPEINTNVSFKEYLNSKFQANLPKAMDFTIDTIDGKQISISSFKGRWILLDFWGTWCSPCISELPKLNKFYLDYCKPDDSKIKLAIPSKIDYFSSR